MGICLSNRPKIEIIKPNLKEEEKEKEIEIQKFSSSDVKEEIDIIKPKENISDLMKNIKLKDAFKSNQSSNKSSNNQINQRLDMLKRVENSNIHTNDRIIKVNNPIPNDLSNVNTIKNINKSLKNEPSKTYDIVKDNSDFNIRPKILKNINQIDSLYSIKNKLGKGSFGMVFKVIHLRTNTERAMKVINKEYISSTTTNDSSTFLNEIEILIKIDHMNIIKIYEYFEDDINFYIISELLLGGELLEGIISLKYINEFHVRYIMKQLLSAVSYLHQNSIIHRDIKPENILIESIKDDCLVNIKLIDFGTSNYINEKKLQKEKVGTPNYVAPEVIDGKYNEKCDIWSCGVIFYILLVGKLPFTGKSTEDLYKRIKNENLMLSGVIWESISLQAKDLIKKMLNKSYSQRPSAVECLRDSFFISKYSNNLNSIDETTNKTEFYNNYLIEKLGKISNFNLINNLKEIHYQDKLQQATIAYIIHYLTPSKETEKMKKVFVSLDKNGDGMLSKNEIIEGIRISNGRNYSSTQIENLIDELDNNRDGQISYDEFLRLVVNNKKILSEENLKICFEAFDINKDNKLSAEELTKALGSKDEYYVKELIRLIDDNGNSEIDFYEFKQLMDIIIKKEINN